MGILEKVKELGLDWPAVPAAVGSYVPASAGGNLIFTSGQLPLKNGVLTACGKVSVAVPLDVAQAAAAQAVLNCLAAAAGAAGSPDNIARIIRMNVYVNSSAGFADQAKVANGASDLLIKLFGQAGRHTRCAVGVAELPLNAPVEIDLVVERK